MWKYILAAIAVLGIGVVAMGDRDEEEPPPPGEMFLVDEGEMTVRETVFAYRVWETPDGFLGELEIDVGWVATEPSMTIEEAIMRLRVLAESHAPAGRDLGSPEDVIVTKARPQYKQARGIVTGIPTDVQLPLAKDLCAGTKKGVTSFGKGPGLNLSVERHPSWLPFYDFCIGYIDPGTYVGIPGGFYVVLWRPGDEDRIAVIGPYDSWVEVPGGRPEFDVERGIRSLLRLDFEDVYAATRE